MSENLKAELIQVAAVAVAILEDLVQGRADHDYYWNNNAEGLSILGEISQERSIQDFKHGPQHHDIQTWLTILMEEVGEAAQAALDEVVFP